MNCKQCGALIQPDQAFCAKCGHMADQASAPVSPTTPMMVTYAAAAEPAEVVYAGFWERFAAQFVDSFILWLLMIPFSFVAALLVRNNAMAMTFVAYIGIFALYWLYYALLESGEKSATLGKRWLGLKVLTADDHDRISFLRATGRFFGRFLSAILFYVGYLMQPFTSKRQTLHDVMTNVVVIREEGRSRRGWIIAIVVAFFLVAMIGILAAIAIPAYQDYVGRARVAEAMIVGEQATQAVERYYKANGSVPATLADAGLSPALPHGLASVEVNPDNGTVTLAIAGEQYTHAALILTPSQDERGAIHWACEYTGLPARTMTRWRNCQPYGTAAN